MININELSINNLIKEKYNQEGYILIDNIIDAEDWAKKALIKQKGNFILSKPYLLSIFIASIKYYKNNIVELINCNASKDRLLNDLEDAKNSNNLCIFYNIKDCNNDFIISQIGMDNKPYILCL